MVAHYNVKIDEDMIIRAVKTGQLEFLYCSFCYNKNYQESLIQSPRVEEISDDDKIEESSLESSESDRKAFKEAFSRSKSMSKKRETRKVVTTFTFDYTFKKILENCSDQAHNRIRVMSLWRISSTESFMKSLLKNNLDKIAW